MTTKEFTKSDWENMKDEFSENNTVIMIAEFKDTIKVTYCQGLMPLPFRGQKGGDNNGYDGSAKESTS